MQDSKGYYWFSTNNGIARFNGFQFSVYNTSNGLADNEIYQITEDNKGRLWFPCNNGELSYWEDGKFMNRGNSAELASFETPYIGLSVKEDKKGSMFFLAQKNIFKSDGQKFVAVKTPIGSANSTLIKTVGGNVFSITYDPENMYLLDLTNSRSTTIPHFKRTGMPRLNTKAIELNGKIWYGADNALMVVNENEKIVLVEQEFETTVQCVISYDDNRIWVGTKKGLHLWNTSTKKVERSWFTSSSISHVFKDTEGNIWISTLNNGVYVVNNLEVELINQTNGLGFDYVISLKIFDSIVAVGSTQFNYAFVRAGGTWQFNMTNRAGGGFVKNFAKDPEGNIYALTAVNMQKHTKDLKVKGTFKASIKDLCFDGDSVFIASANGISVIDRLNFNKNLDVIEKLYYSNVYKNAHASFFIRNGESIYYAGNAGISCLRNCVVNKYNEDSDFKKNITDVIRRGSFNIISSGISGVKITRGGHRLVLNKENGLSSSFITGIAVDEKNNIWASTPNGLCCIKLDTTRAGISISTIKVFDEANGLVTNAITDVAYANGKIWLGTPKGLCNFKNNALELTRGAPKVIIESVWFGDSVQQQGNHGYTVPYNVSDFEVQFVAISSTFLNRVKFQYRMVGLEEGWNTTEQLMLRYPGLAPGEYSFQIRAVAPNGVTSSVESLSIKVTPAFYQTIWFKIVSVILIIIALMYVVYVRIKVLKKSHALKQYLLKSENRRLELENEEVQL